MPKGDVLDYQISGSVSDYQIGTKQPFNRLIFIK
jgi:hypothetical protein